MDLPQTLYGQLYLLAYDRHRHRFPHEKLLLLGFALRAAMLTDLYLTGYLLDTDGKACHATSARPGDPLLRAVFDTVDVDGPQSWEWLIAVDQHLAPIRVREQLEVHGSLRTQRHRMLGIIPTSRIGPADEDAVEGLADRVDQALRNAINDRFADPRLLALGLLGVLGALPTVFDLQDREQHSRELLKLALASISPILGLHKAVESVYRARHTGRYPGTAGGGVGGGVGCGGGG